MRRPALALTRVGALALAGALAVGVGAIAARAACPAAGDPLPASYSYDIDGGRRTAQAAAVLPLPTGRVTPIVDAVRAEPTWTNLEAQDGIPKPARLRPLLANPKLVDPEMTLEAAADPQCPGATRVTARFSWSLGALARMAGGDAKDLPSLLPIVLRDEVIARAVSTGDAARSFAGAAREPGLELVRVAPEGLVVPDASMAAIRPRLQGLGKSSDLGDVLAVFLDLHRSATAIGGFGVLSRKGDTAVFVSGPCPGCEIGYDIDVSESPDGKGGSIMFGLKGYRPPTSP